MDTIAPKVSLIGHSAGGFASYTIGHNPKEKINDGNEFTYDGGNGVAKMIILGSPVGTGMPQPMPEGLADWPFGLVDKHVLSPMENSPAMDFALNMNPAFAWMYGVNKDIMKASYNMGMKMFGNMTNPVTYAMKPGYEQVAEGSEFVEKYIIGKKVPENVTAISVFSQQDKVSEARSAQIDDTQTNAFNLDVEVTLTEEEMNDPERTPGIMAHRKMSMMPFEQRKEFKDEIFYNPKQILKLLDPKNYDGVRWESMQHLSDMYDKDPAIFEKPEFKPVLKKIKDVADEKLPFNDSPSYLAKKFLDTVSNN